MKSFSQMLERFFESNSKNASKSLKWRSARVESLEARELLSVTANDMGQIAVYADAPLETNAEALVTLPGPGPNPGPGQDPGQDSDTVKVSYVNERGEVKSANAKVVDASMKGTWEAGWYIVNENVTINNASITCDGKVNLILADGAVFTVRAASNKAGIAVSGKGNSLTLFGQSEGTGTLNVTGGMNAAGIGGNNGEKGEDITIVGGNVLAAAGTNADAIGSGKGGDAAGKITINSGLAAKVGANNMSTSTIELKKDCAEALAGNKYVNIQQKVDVCYVNDRGKSESVEATLVDSAMKGTWAAGWYVVNGNVNISNSAVTCSGDVKLILADGATLTIRGASNKAGIAVSGKGNRLNVFGQCEGSGKLNVTGGMNAAGIGGNNGEKGENITIVGGLITANAGTNADAIGSGKGAEAASNIKVNSDLAVKAGANNTSTSTVATADMKEDIADSLAGNKYANIQLKVDACYVNELGKTEYVAATLVDSAMKGTWAEGWYVVNGNVNISNSAVTCDGEVNLILADGATLTIRGASNKAGIAVSGKENSLNVYGQCEGSGKLNVTGGMNAAGLGGNNGENGEYIAIYDGVIDVKAGTNAAAIGGGYNALGKHIDILGGNVTATSTSASAVGSGKGGDDSYDIAVKRAMLLMAGSNAKTAEVIKYHSSKTDSADDLADQKYVSASVVDEALMVMMAGDLDD